MENNNQHTAFIIFKVSRFECRACRQCRYKFCKASGRRTTRLYVLELSSFQLEAMTEFRADYAVMLNITPDHLDRYAYQMQNYVDAKMKILNNQTVDNCFIYWEMTLDCS